MPWYSRRMLLGGAASVCLLVVSGTLVWKTMKVYPEVARLEPQVPVPAVASEERAASPALSDEGQKPDDSRANEAYLTEQSRRDAEASALQKSKEEQAAKLQAKAGAACSAGSQGECAGIGGAGKGW